MNRILLAGATGCLGSYVTIELLKRGFSTRALVRKPGLVEQEGGNTVEIFQAELTQPDSLDGACRDIDTVISTVGITKQNDGLSYMDVDYQANMNLLSEAKKDGVKKFIYVSVLNGENLAPLKICEAKERFVEQLKNSGLEYCVIRPNGFFSDMAEFQAMAKKGRIYLFGNGESKSNPVHGADLAEVCVDAIEKPGREINIGGPETLTHNEMAELAFASLGRDAKISYIPNPVRLAVLKMLRLFTPARVYGPVEFFMTVMAMDMVAPEYGKHTLGSFFNSLSNRN